MLYAVGCSGVVFHHFLGRAYRDIPINIDKPMMNLNHAFDRPEIGTLIVNINHVFHFIQLFFM